MSLALSQVEADALRSLRTRLNRPPVSDAASATLGRAFLQVVARSDLIPAGAVPAASTSAEALLAEVARADMAGLNRCLARLQPVLADPPAWRRLQAAGVPQAVVTRRLQLAGREPDPHR